MPGVAMQTKARILAQKCSVWQGNAGIGHQWQGKDFSVAGPGRAGLGKARQPKARILAWQCVAGPGLAWQAVARQGF